MSYTTMYSVPKKHQLKSFRQYSNSYGSAMNLWDYLWKKYCRQNETDYMFSNYQRLWDLAKDPRLQEFEIILLNLTFDRMILKQKDFKRVSDACFELYKETKKLYPDNSNHWFNIAQDIKRLPKTCYGVCFRWTSVADCWEVYSKNKESSRLYRLSDKKHWILNLKEAIDAAK